MFDLYQGAIKDISLNEATERLNFPLAETPDHTPQPFWGLKSFSESAKFCLNSMKP